jgi:hypothetical protein
LGGASRLARRARHPLARSSRHQGGPESAERRPLRLRRACALRSAASAGRPRKPPADAPSPRATAKRALRRRRGPPRVTNGVVDRPISRTHTLTLTFDHASQEERR